MLPVRITVVEHVLKRQARIDNEMGRVSLEVIRETIGAGFGDVEDFADGCASMPSHAFQRTAALTLRACASRLPSAIEHLPPILRGIALECAIQLCPGTAFLQKRLSFPHKSLQVSNTGKKRFPPSGSIGFQHRVVRDSLRLPEIPSLRKTKDYRTADRDGEHLGRCAGFGDELRGIP